MAAQTQIAKRTTHSMKRPAWMRPDGPAVSLYQGRDRVADEAIGRADRALARRAAQTGGADR